MRCTVIFRDRVATFFNDYGFFGRVATTDTLLDVTILLPVIFQEVLK